MKQRKTNVALVTAAIFIGTFMTAIEGTIVSTAMPTIIGSLHGVHLMNWVFSIFLLTNGSGLIKARRHGAKAASAENPDCVPEPLRLAESA